MKQTSLSDFMEDENSLKVHRKGFIESHKNLSRSFEYINKTRETQWHKTHRLLFVFDYEGIQPIRYADKIVKFGRYGTIKQAYYYYNEDKAIIISLPHTLKVWIKHPSGIKTTEQLAEARKYAWDAVRSFSMKQGIQILQERQRKGFSEHTVEQKSLDNALRPIIEQEPILAREKLGLSINLTSHKDKVEWTGSQARERVMVLEWWLDKGTDRLIQLAENVATLTEKVNFIVDWIKKR